MRLLHVCPAYVHPTHRVSGVPKAAFDLAEAMAELGHTVDFVAPLVELNQRFTSPKEGLLSVEKRLQLHYVLEAQSTRFGTTATGLRSVLAPLLLECDIVHVHAFFSLWTDVACRMASSSSKPYVIQPHGKLSEKMLANRAFLKGLYLHTFGRGLLRRSAAVSLLTQSSAQYLREWDPSIPSWVCPNGLDASAYDGPVPARPISEPYILYLGMLDPRKRLDILIDAFAQLQTKMRSGPLAAVKLALVGGGCLWIAP